MARYNFVVKKRWLVITLVAIALAVIFVYHVRYRPERIWTEVWGAPPPKHLTLVNAERRSGEGIAAEWAVFFEIKPSQKYLDLQKDQKEASASSYSIPDDAPRWFIPNRNIASMRVFHYFDASAQVFVFLHREEPLVHSGYIIAMNLTK